MTVAHNVPRLFPFAGLFCLLAGILVSAGTAVAAGPVYWDYPESYAFSAMELDGVALDRFDRLVPGLKSDELLAGEPEVFWRAVPDDRGGFFVGSGHGGQIWHVAKDGKSRLFATVEGTEVFSLLRYGDELLTGCGPDGQLYRIKRDGTAELFGQIPDGYIWALAAGPDREVYLATGAPAALYRMTGDGTLEQLAELPAFNALDLVVTDDNRILITTQGPGLVYEIDRTHPEQRRLLFEAEQDEVRQIIAGPDGTYYVLALPAEQNGSHNGEANPANDKHNGGFGLLDLIPPATPKLRAALYRLGDDGLVTTHWSGDVDLMIAAYSESWGWLGGGPRPLDGGRVRLWSLSAPADARPLAAWDGGDILDLMIRPGRGGLDEIVACLAHPGQVVRLARRDGEEATAVSQPLDGGQPVRWARLSWSGTGKGLRWSVRTGARSVPDETWSDWTDSWSDRDHALKLQPSRYLQWRVSFSRDDREVHVAAVTVSGWQPNLPPRIEGLVLQPPGPLAPGGLMSGKDNITQRFKSGLRIEYNLANKRDRRVDAQRGETVRPLRTFLWKATDPNDDRLLYQLEYQRVGEETWRPIGTEQGAVVGSWDTAAVADGSYVIRLRASDRLDNTPAAADTVFRTTAPMQVDNTPPRLSGLELSRSESGFRLQFSAEDATSALAGAHLEHPDGTVERLDPLDRVCDSLAERFEIDVAYPRPGGPVAPRPWRVRVEVYDRHGNVSAEEGEVR